MSFGGISGCEYLTLACLPRKARHRVSRDGKAVSVAAQCKGGRMNVHQTDQLLSERMPDIRRRFGVR